MKLLLYGDTHLSSRKVGYHKDYTKHSLNVLDTIVHIAKNNYSQIIGLGDFADGIFTLPYRLEVEKRLNEINQLTNNQHYMIQGNHDKSTSGLTEYEFYIEKGTLKTVPLLELEHINIYMANYSELGSVVIKDNGKKNILLCHDYLVFKDDDKVNQAYKPLYIEDYDNLRNLDLVVCGHIHSKVRFCKDNLNIVYVGSPSMKSIDSDTTSFFLEIDIDDNGDFTPNFIPFSKQREELYDLDKYKLDVLNKEVTESMKATIENTLDLTNLNNYVPDSTNYRSLIENMETISKEVRICAINLLTDN